MEYSKGGGGRVGGGRVFSGAGSGGYGMMFKTFREVGRGRKEVFEGSMGMKQSIRGLIEYIRQGMSRASFKF